VAAPAFAHQGAADIAQVTQADVREVIRRLAVLRVDGNPGDPLAGDDVRRDLIWLQEHADLAAPIIQREIAKSAEASADFATGVAAAAANDPDPPLGSHIALAALIRFFPEEHREPMLAAAAQSIDAALTRAVAAQQEASDRLEAVPLAELDDRADREQRIRDASSIAGGLVVTSQVLITIAAEWQSSALLESCVKTIERRNYEHIMLTLLGDYKRYLGLVLDENPAAALRIKNALDARTARNGGHTDYVAKTLAPIVDRALRLN
jgi:hypothetical protein